MKKNKYLILICALGMVFNACDSWLEREPKDILTENEAYSSVSTITSIVGGLYNRLPDWGGIEQTPSSYTELDEGMLGQNVNNFIAFPNSYGSYYADAYILIRDINNHLSKIPSSTFLNNTQKKYYVAEARFLRAYVYFELVKRMGGVPLFDANVIYSNPNDLLTYARSRSSEAAIYDFIASEIDAIKEDLNLTPQVQYNRASKGAALALKSRAMLYAATLARYNSSMSIPLTLPDGEVGIPKEKAEDYFRQSLQASKELLAMGVYELYNKNSDKSRNFYEALTKSVDEGNKEIIFVKQYGLPSNLQNWTYNNLPRTLREGGFSGEGGTYINPSLNLVDAFENIDGTNGKINPYMDASHKDEIGNDASIDGNPDAYIYYDNPSDIFINKDPRLAGTIIYPGSKFGSKDIDLRAGYAYYNASTGKLEFKSGSLENLTNNVLKINNNLVLINGSSVQTTGLDGPSTDTYCTRTGFYVRKWMDENPVGDKKQSAIQFVRYRLSEIYLNAAEAAYELGKTDSALIFVKVVRDRAGITTKAVSLELIRNERRVELAFEGQRYFDLKRWRIANQLFDGSVSTPTAMIYGLWPYKVYRPGDATDGKWIYVRRIPTTFSAPRKFLWANYYSEIPSAAIAANPKLIKNPGQ
jgi:hypothetical protein